MDQVENSRWVDFNPKIPRIILNMKSLKPLIKI